MYIFKDGDQDCSAVVEHCSMARLWCEQIDVIASGVLTVLSANELKRQEVRCAHNSETQLL